MFGSKTMTIDPFRIAQILIERPREWLDITPDSAIQLHDDRLGMVLAELIESPKQPRI